LIGGICGICMLRLLSRIFLCDFSIALMRVFHFPSRPDVSLRSSSERRVLKSGSDSRIAFNPDKFVLFGYWFSQFLPLLLTSSEHRVDAASTRRWNKKKRSCVFFSDPQRRSESGDKKCGNSTNMTSGGDIAKPKFFTG
jgi:hypothetical protein